MQITGSATNIALSITGSVIAMPQMASSLTGSFTGSVGNVWFNTDTNKLQYTVLSGTWVAGSAMITARSVSAGVGTNSAALAIASFELALAGCTEAYNGATWSSGGSLIFARNNLAGAGTTTAALAFGGYLPAASNRRTEAYNGTTWSSAPAMILGGDSFSGVGTQNAALSVNIYSGGGGQCTEGYNGTSWSYVGNTIAVTNKRAYNASAGTCLAAITIGGLKFTPNTLYPDVNLWNGTSWSTATSIITARFLGAATGTQNNALIFNGSTPANVTCTELYNGTSWSTKSGTTIAKSQIGGAGNGTVSLSFGGITPTSLSCTEIYNSTITCSI